MATQVSTKPWSNFKSANYTPQQWKAACLIVHGDGSSKIMCSLPVREPDGTLNRNGMAAAAAALGGSRGGVIASAATKADAAKKLTALYKQIGEDPPPSLQHSAIDLVDDDIALEHHGIKGMKWGVRRSEGSDGTVSSAHPGPADSSGGHGSSGSSSPSHSINDRVGVTDAQKAAMIKGKAQKTGLNSLTTGEMQFLVNRMNLERQYAQLTATPSKFEKGRAFMDNQLKTGKTINDMIKFANSPAGNLIAGAMRSKGTGKHAVGKHAFGVPAKKP